MSRLDPVKANSLVPFNLMEMATLVFLFNVEMKQVLAIRFSWPWLNNAHRLGH